MQVFLFLFAEIENQEMVAGERIVGGRGVVEGGKGL